jgi:aspartate oxidase
MSQRCVSSWSNASARMRDLLSRMVCNWTRTEGELLVGREGGHSASRIYHADGDATGRELQRCLNSRADRCRTCASLSSAFTLDLITASDEPGSR